MSYDATRDVNIDVVNVRKKFLKRYKRVFYSKNKKSFVNVIKNVTLFFLLAFDVGPID